MRSLLLFPLLALIAHAQDKVPAGLEKAEGPTAGFGCPCQHQVKDLPALPGDDAKKLGAVEKPQKLAEGVYVADSVKGDIALAAGTLYVKGTVNGSIRIEKKGGVILIGANFSGTIEAMCPFTVIIGGSSYGDVTANHDRADAAHGRCLLVVGWFPGKPVDEVVKDGEAPKDPPVEKGDGTLETVARRQSVEASGLFRLSEVVVLGMLEGTIDSRGSGLMTHVDKVDLKKAKIVGGGQVICLQKLRWTDYPALLRNVLDAKVDFNPVRITQLTFQQSDVPKGFYRVTDEKLRPKLNGGDGGEVELRVMGPMETTTGSEGSDEGSGK
ncbi:MAG: hypothetical protein AAB074_00805 [Planctomycetota bacterium]